MPPSPSAQSWDSRYASGPREGSRGLEWSRVPPRTEARVSPLLYSRRNDLPLPPDSRPGICWAAHFWTAVRVAADGNRVFVIWHAATRRRATENGPAGVRDSVGRRRNFGPPRSLTPPLGGVCGCLRTPAASRTAPDVSTSCTGPPWHLPGRPRILLDQAAPSLAAALPVLSRSWPVEACPDGHRFPRPGAPPPSGRLWGAWETGRSDSSRGAWRPPGSSRTGDCVPPARARHPALAVNQNRTFSAPGPRGRMAARRTRRMASRVRRGTRRETSATGGGVSGSGASPAVLPRADGCSSWPTEQDAGSRAVTRPPRGTAACSCGSAWTADPRTSRPRGGAWSKELMRHQLRKQGVLAAHLLELHDHRMAGFNSRSGS